MWLELNISQACWTTAGRVLLSNALDVFQRRCYDSRSHNGDQCWRCSGGRRGGASGWVLRRHPSGVCVPAGALIDPRWRRRSAPALQRTRSRSAAACIGSVGGGRSGAKRRSAPVAGDDDCCTLGRDLGHGHAGEAFVFSCSYVLQNSVFGREEGCLLKRSCDACLFGFGVGVSVLLSRMLSGVRATLLIERACV